MRDGAAVATEMPADHVEGQAEADMRQIHRDLTRMSGARGAIFDGEQLGHDDAEIKRHAGGDAEADQPRRRSRTIRGGV